MSGSGPVRFHRYEGDAIRGDVQLRTRLGDLFVAAFGQPPASAADQRPESADGEGALRWADDRLVQHAAYPGFRLVAAEHEGRLLGLAYGVLGAEDQWFTQAVRARVSEEVAHAWLGEHGELVELAVAPGARSRGLGRALHDEAVAGLRAAGARRALLVVDTHAAPARALYRSRGWRELADLGHDSLLLGLSARALGRFGE